MAAIMPSSSTSPIPDASSTIYVGHPDASSTIYVGHLHPDVTEAHLLDVFSEFEGLESVCLSVSLYAATGKSRRFGHVFFSSPLGADMAIKAKNRSKLNGKEIRVFWVHRGIGNLSVQNLGDSIDNMTNSSIQDSRSQQPAGQSIYLGRSSAGEKIYRVTPLSAEEICRRKVQRLRRRMKYSTPEQQRTLLRMDLDYALEKLKPDFSAMTSAKIADKIMEMDCEEVLGLLDTPESLSAKVEELVEVLELANEPPRQRFVSFDLPGHTWVQNPCGFFPGH